MKKRNLIILLILGAIVVAGIGFGSYYGAPKISLESGQPKPKHQKPASPETSGASENNNKSGALNTTPSV